jgi:hypothetical protein
MSKTRKLSTIQFTAAEFAEARMHFRGLFLPSHLLPSNLRPLAKAFDDNRKRKVVSLLQVLVLQQVEMGKRLHGIVGSKPRLSMCARIVVPQCVPKHDKTSHNAPALLLHRDDLRLYLDDRKCQVTRTMNFLLTKHLVDSNMSPS